MIGGWITSGEAFHRCTPRMPDMAWLGDPPDARRAARYEAIRAGRHLVTVALDRAMLRQRADALARELDAHDDTRTARKRIVDELNAVHNRLASVCDCDICARGAAQ